MPDYEIIMRMVYFKKDLEHMFDVSRRRDSLRTPPSSGNRSMKDKAETEDETAQRAETSGLKLPSISEDAEFFPGAALPLGQFSVNAGSNKENEAIGVMYRKNNSNGTTAPNKEERLKKMDKADFLRAERGRRVDKRG